MRAPASPEVIRARVVAQQILERGQDKAPPTMAMVREKVDALRSPAHVDSGELPDVAEGLHIAALQLSFEDAGPWRQAFERLAAAVFTRYA